MGTRLEIGQTNTVMNSDGIEREVDGGRAEGNGELQGVIT